LYFTVTMAETIDSCKESKLNKPLLTEHFFIVIIIIIIMKGLCTD